MGVGISKQIGWSQEANLLYEILRELDYLNLVTADVTGNCVCPTTTTTTLPYVTIGTQTWTLRNLDVTTYANGDVIPEVTDQTEWVNATTGAWCYYNNDPTNGVIYGKLYNWYAVNDPRGLAPAGYHIPTNAEWLTLINYNGGLSVAGGKIRETGTSHWLTPNTDATNSSGFTALPGSLRYNDGSWTIPLNIVGLWWTSTEDNPIAASYAITVYNNADIQFGSFVKSGGISVRLIKD